MLTAIGIVIGVVAGFGGRTDIIMFLLPVLGMCIGADLHILSYMKKDKAKDQKGQEGA